MAICYGSVAFPDIGIVAEYAKDKRQNFHAVVSSMVPNIAAQNQSHNNKILFTHDRYKFAVLSDHGIYYICVTTPDLLEKDSFVFLDEMKEYLTIKNVNLNEVVENRIQKGHNKTKHHGSIQIVDIENADIEITDIENADIEHAEIENADIESVPLPVVVTLDVKKARRISALLKKTIKRWTKNRQKSNKTRIRKRTNDSVSADLTPSSPDKYVALESKDGDKYTPRTTGTSSNRNNAIKNLQDQVDEVQDITRKGVEKVLARDDKLVDLLGRAQELQVKSHQFKKTTRRLKWKARWRNRRITIITVGGVILAVIIATVIIVFTVL